MALVAKVLYDFGSNKTSATDDDDFRVVILMLMVAHCVKFFSVACRAA